MPSMIRSLTSLATSRIVPVLICLCTFSFSLVPSLGLPTLVESSEEERPAEEDGKKAEEELVVCSSARRRLHPKDSGRLREGCDQSHQVSRYTSFLAGNFGRQFASGLCVPLLI
jgi:hypothetical protein